MPSALVVDSLIGPLRLESADSVALNRKARRAAQRLIGTRERPGPARKSAFDDGAALAALCERYGMLSLIHI